MKRKLISTLSVVVAFVFGVSLTACAGGDVAFNGTNAEISAAISSILTADGIKGNAEWRVSSKNSDSAGSSEFEKRGDKIKVDGGIADLSTGYVYAETQSGIVVSQEFPADMIGYVKYMLESYKNQLGENTDSTGGIDQNKKVEFMFDLSSEKKVSVDVAARSITYSIDAAKKINELIAPMYDAYSKKKTVKAWLESYPSIVKVGDDEWTFTNIYAFAKLALVSNKSQTVGALMQVFAIDLESVLVGAGINVSQQQIAAIEARTLNEMLVGLYDYVNSKPAIGFSLIGGAIEAMFFNQVDVTNADTKIASLESLIETALSYKVNNLIDKYLSAANAPAYQRDFYEAIKTGTKLEKAYSALTVKFDGANKIVALSFIAELKHNYSGSAGAAFLKDNDYRAAANVAINEYTGETADFEITPFADNADLVNVVQCAVYGEIKNDVSVYIETNGLTMTDVSIKIVKPDANDGNAEQALDAAQNVRYDVQTKSVVFDKTYLATEFADAVTGDAVVAWLTADINGSPESIMVELFYFGDNPVEIIKFIIENM